MEYADSRNAASQSLDLEHAACNGFFLPYQSTTYLTMYHGSGEKLFTHAQTRPAALAYGGVTLLALCGSVIAWRAMGLL